MALRELLILQSFYLCETRKQIYQLVKLQPNPKLFYKTFLELNVSNITTMMSFDGKSMEYLLSSEHQQLFDPKFPIIYMTKL